jgi:aryl-alcohol dehydrogenase-like predicted oxidoreductase
MNYRFLGKSTLQVSEISFGCMSLGDNQAVNNRLIGRAIELGINLFDTADMYQQGKNEISLGKSLAGIRPRVFISSKVGNQLRADGTGTDWNPNKKYILSAVDKSLERLQTDYIDLYLLHGGTIEDPIDETIEAFELLQEKGKIRFYGISSIRPNVIREYVTRSRISTVMMQYSLLDRRAEESCFSLLLKNGISVLARGALAKGILADKESSNYLNYTKNEVTALKIQLKKFADKENTMGQIALRYVLQQSVICSAVVGIRTILQLKEAVQAGNLGFLSADILSGLSQVLPANKYEQHR